jgi:S-methylmethionine-dependent homocysteine/selenocysteine methylase
LATTSIAREGVRQHGTQVAASIGPFGASLADGSEYHGNYGTSFATVEKYHGRKLEVLVESAPDAFAVETQLRSDEVQAIASQLVKLGSPPTWFSFGFRDESTTYGGQSVQDIVDAVADYPNLLALGVNCTAPHLVTAILQQIAAAAPGVPLIAYPNHGGQWDPNARSWVRPSGEVFGLQRLGEWQSAGAQYIGGCCGVGPRDIADLVRVIDKKPEIEPKNGNQ